MIYAMIFSGASAFAMSYASAWCVRTTSSTTYSMVGALNKLPIAASGILFFGDPATFANVTAIIIGRNLTNMCLVRLQLLTRCCAFQVLLLVLYTLMQRRSEASPQTTSRRVSQCLRQAKVPPMQPRRTEKCKLNTFRSTCLFFFSFLIAPVDEHTILFLLLYSFFCQIDAL